MKRSVVMLIFIFVLLVTLVGPVHAQTYRFQVPRTEVAVFIGDDGIVTIEYWLDFFNDINADAIDFVDIGLPNDKCCRISDIRADIGGNPITDVSNSPYVKPGVALGLGSNAIRPGMAGRVHVVIQNVRSVIYPGTEKESEGYASFQFSPNYFGSEFVYGQTDYTVTLHLPPGLTENEPRFYPAEKWPGDTSPESGFDANGSIYYRWQTKNANASTAYVFGTAFPARTIPENTIVPAPPPFKLDFEDLCCAGFALLFIGSFGFGMYQAIWGAKKRMLKYLPPKIAIEGHGIKRGLTAIEAAVLMEEPVDKVLTMILFSTIKKNAVTVTSREPVKLEIHSPLPDNLTGYEQEFIQAFREPNDKARQVKLQDTMVILVKSLTEKMKGFSRKESIEYYKNIMEKAWKYVEDADTPEVKTQKYDEVMDWTMLDKDFSGKTREVFRTGPVFVPTWWGRYDPSFGGSRTASGGKVGSPIPTPSGKGSLSMPTLPGGQFAASMAGGIQSFAGGVIGDISSFTSKITNKTNPPPKPSTSSSRGGGGGSSCACACACAGCACACAGGGR